MKVALATIFVFSALALGQTNLIANVPARKTTSLNGTWHFIVDPYANGDGSRYYENRKPKGPQDLVEYDFATSPTLKVPGDWNSQREDLLWYEGAVWYERSFSYQTSSGKRTFLHFGAANYRAVVYLNGEKVGEHVGGFTPFNFEVTGKIHSGENFVVVQVDNTRLADGVPTLSTDWWNYGGITRNVTIVEVPTTFIENYSLQLAKNDLGRISGWIQISGLRTPQKVSVEIPEAHVRQQITTDSKGYASLHFPATLELWSPEKPKLYDVTISTGDDSLADRIGFRTIETRGTQILLNGKPIFLRGISIHEEAPFRSGRAFSAEDDLTLLNWAKELGCNYVRLAHYPHNEAMTRLADKLGLLVWSEIPVYWDIDWSNPATLANAEQQLKENIAASKSRVDRFWSIANETPVTPARLVFLKKLVADIRQIDTTRLISAAMNRTGREGNTRLIDDPLGEFVDVLSVNEYIGWYEGKLEDVAHTRWKTSWQKPLIFSEFGAEAPYGNHGDAGSKWTEEYQAKLYGEQIAMLRNIPQLAGLSPWLLMDFRSPRRPLPFIQDYHNKKGLISNRGERKQAFYVLQNYYRELEKKQ
jgi:beta-glucuronidase